MKTVILCGGKGTRLREETEFKPKPLVEIGGKPILWHIMKIYSAFGQNRFILALGEKGEQIKEYFMRYNWKENDFSLHLKDRGFEFLNPKVKEDWTIDFIDTGSEALTALRLFRLKDFLQDEDNFMLTYGDGLANVNLNELIKFHLSRGRLATITGLHPHSKYGVIKTDHDGLVLEFKEKPVLDNFINGGFMVFRKQVFEELSQDNIMLEDFLVHLAVKRELALFHHEGFWHCMDTYKDYLELNKMWLEKPEWKIW